MSSNDKKRAIELLLYYETQLREKVHYIFNNTVSSNTVNLAMRGMAGVHRANAENSIKIKKGISEILLLEDEIVRLIRGNFIAGLLKNVFFYRRLFNNELKTDVSIVTNDLRNIVKLSREMRTFLESVEAGKEAGNASQLGEKLTRYVEELGRITEHFGKVLGKSIYAEEFVRNLDVYLRKLWEVKFHNRFYWLYHGTSILFLKNIQKYGLDNTKTSKGINRALNAVTSYFRAAGLRGDSTFNAGFGFDLTRDTEKEFIYLTPYSNAISSARAPNLPAFLYEVLNEAAFTENAKEAVLSVLPEEDKSMLRVCWKFGGILRAKNRLITLLIKVDSNFLKYFGIPDMFGNYDEFAKACIREEEINFLKGKTQTQSDLREFFEALGVFRKPLSEVVQQSIENIGRGGDNNEFFGGNIGWWTHLEVVLKKVPPEFIYANVSGKLIPIANVTEDMAPYVN